MLAIQLTMNILSVCVTGLVCLFSGLFLRNTQLQKKNRRVIELEKEMLRSHAEIIELHKQIDLIKSPDEAKITAPIFKIKDGFGQEQESEVKDVSGRKKFLRKTPGLK